MGVLICIGAVAACTGCMRFDLDDPIGVVPAASWSDRDVAHVEAAARCWEMRYGVPFVVDRASTASQRVTIDYNDETCTVAGVFTPGMLATIDICPVDRVPNANQYPLFTVLLHELGHAAGIRGHAPSDASVMGGAIHVAYASESTLNRQVVFSDEDEGMVATEIDAPGGSCDDVRFGIEAGIPQCLCHDPCEPDSFGESTVVLNTNAPLVRTLCASARDNFDSYYAPRSGTVTISVTDGGSEPITIDGEPVRGPRRLERGAFRVSLGQYTRRVPLTYQLVFRPD